MQDSHRSHCPRCTGDKIYRSRRHGFLEHWILPLFGRKPYRCVGCGYRYYRTRTVHAAEEFEIPVTMHEKNAH